MARTTFQQRIITAIIYGLSILFCTLIHPFAFTFSYTLLCGLCAYEFLQLSTSNKNTWRIGTLLSMLPIVLFALLPNILNLRSIFFYLLFIIGFSCFLIFRLYCKKPINIHLKYPILITILYIALPFSTVMLASKYSGHFNGFNVLGIMVLLWAYDSFAYLFGRKIGSTPLFKRISPKKTWEGFFLGASGAIVISFVIPLFKHIHPILEGTLTQTQWLITALIIVNLGSIGDLIESMFKRNSDAKDSGNLLPGHGGFLDRLDSFIFCLAFVVFYWSFV